MSISKQTYKELAIPYFKEVFEIIDDVKYTSLATSYNFLKKWASQEDWGLDLAQKILFEFKKGIKE